MSSTNKTDNYHLSQFVGTDIPSILNDYNGDMRKIDTAIKEVATAEGSSAADIAGLQATVGQHTTEISGLNSLINNVSSSVVNLQGVVATNTENINTVNVLANQTRGDLDYQTSRINAIEGKIPSDASSDNQLTTKSQVEELYGKAIGLGHIDANKYNNDNELVNELNRIVQRNDGTIGADIVIVVKGLNPVGQETTVDYFRRTNNYECFVSNGAQINGSFFVGVDYYLLMEGYSAEHGGLYRRKYQKQIGSSADTLNFELSKLNMYEYRYDVYKVCDYDEISND